MNVNKILETIEHIEKKPLMFMVEANYDSLKSLLTGYFLGIEDCIGVSYNKKFSEWLAYQNKANSALFWSQYILIHLANSKEEIAYQLLLKNVKEFLEDQKED